MTEKGKIYFASDFHLGLRTGSDPVDRERRVVAWLKMASADAKEIYLLGDVFDFWWEYRSVVPRGFTRFLGTVSSITDSGIPVHFFTGNHDMWVSDYLSTECGMIIHTGPITTEFNGRKFHLAHGEGLGTLDRSYKVLLAIFRNKPLRVIYSALHPAIGMGIGHRWSLHSRLAKGIRKDFLGEENEDLIRYARSVMAREHIDHFIFGHRHLGISYKLAEGTDLLFLGDWIKSGSYGVWNGLTLDFRHSDH